MKLYPLRKTFPYTTEKERGRITRAILKRIAAQATPVPSDHRPYAALLLAIIEQSLKDLWLNEESRTQSPKETEADWAGRMRELQYSRENAERWLHSGDIWVAELLGIDSHFVGKTVEAAYEFAYRTGYGQSDRDCAEDDLDDAGEREG